MHTTSTLRYALVDWAIVYKRKHNFLQPRQLRSVNLKVVQWYKPHADFIKVNCDASYEPSTNGSAIGDVFGDAEGQFRGGFGSVIKCAVATKAEALALINGLWAARRQGYNRIILETDAENMSNAFTPAREHGG